MIKQYQVTLYDKQGRYKPISTIVRHEQNSNDDLTLDAIARKEIQTKGVKRICMQKYWDKSDLVKYGYTRVKARTYPPTA